uniref:Uncharacterized protein n=1 Tax=Chenopodium quinoa TaxID=63459 RepID=A0A803N733_CHEQI
MGYSFVHIFSVDSVQAYGRIDDCQALQRPVISEHLLMFDVLKFGSVTVLYLDITSVYDHVACMLLAKHQWQFH